MRETKRSSQAGITYRVEMNKGEDIEGFDEKLTKRNEADGTMDAFNAMLEAEWVKRHGEAALKRVKRLEAAERILARR